MKGFSIILRKELYRVFSDKKLIVSLFVVPAIVMIAIYSLIGKLASSLSDDIESHTSIAYVVNATEDMKEIIKTIKYEEKAKLTYLTAAEYAEKKASLEEGLLAGDVDLVVLVDENFNEVFAAYKNAGDKIPEIKLFYNPTENYSAQAYSVFAEQILGSYQTALIASRVGNIEILNVFNVAEETIAKESKKNSQFLATMLPYMVMIMLFAGAMSVGVDAFAGEKERGTLASMLVSPVKRTEIAMGKLVALAIVSAISSIIYCISMIVGMTMMNNGMSGMDTDSLAGLKFTPVQGIQLLLMLLVLDYFFVAIIAILSTLSKDVKSASSLVSPVYMVVLVAAMATMFTVGKKHAVVQYMIPLYGSALALQDITTGELTTLGFLLAFASILVISGALTFVLSKAFDNDKLMFNA